VLRAALLVESITTPSVSFGFALNRKGPTLLSDMGTVDTQQTR